MRFVMLHKMFINKFCNGIHGDKKMVDVKLETYQNGDFYVTLVKRGKSYKVFAMDSDMTREVSSHTVKDFALESFEQTCQRVDKLAADGLSQL